MGLISKKILGVSITIESKDAILEKVKKYLGKVKNKGEKPLVIFTPNPEIIAYSQKDEVFKRIVNSAQINIPDGYGVSLALKKKYHLTIPRLTGVDFVADLSELSCKRGFRIGIIGGRRRVALQAAECLKQQHPALKIEVLEASEMRVSVISGQLSVGVHDGEERIKTDTYFSNLIKEIRRKKIDILLVALGFPKQEYFTEKLKCQISNIKQNPKSKLKPIVLMSIGGALDYISGSVARAPRWMRERGLEWLYRLIREPWRLPRQIRGARFFLDMLRYY